jgi:hypothetical protein
MGTANLSCADIFVVQEMIEQSGTIPGVEQSFLANGRTRERLGTAAGP